MPRGYFASRPTDLGVRMDRLSIPEPMSGCLLWIGNTNPDGYGKVSVGGKMLKAHRVAWERANGPIPTDLVIDHLCRVRSCINPAHLRVVTFAENVRCGESPGARNHRATHCRQGHELDGRYPNGRRFCKTCRAVWGARRRARNRDMAARAAA
jgi:hypothetical protein